MSDQQKFYLIDACINNMEAVGKELEITDSSFSSCITYLKTLRTSYYNSYNTPNT